MILNASIDMPMEKTFHISIPNLLGQGYLLVLFVQHLGHRASGLLGVTTTEIILIIFISSL